MDKGFNVRVYGICINEKDEVLLSKESYAGKNFTKFPGGGLKNGEGTIDCLKREFIEELNWPINELEHFYTTDLYVPSAFNDREQIISIYFLVKDKPMRVFPDHTFWRSLNKLSKNDVTFPIDKKVAEMLRE